MGCLNNHQSQNFSSVQDNESNAESVEINPEEVVSK